MEYKIVIVKIGKRNDKAPDVQKILTDFGCQIRVRLGLHENASDDSCSPSGLIFLQVGDNEAEVTKMIDTLNSVESVSAKYLKI